MEVLPTVLDMDPADPILGLSQVFSNTDSCTSLDPAVDIPVAAVSLPSTSLHLDFAAPGDPQDSGATSSEPSFPKTQTRRLPTRYGEWLAH